MMNIQWVLTVRYSYILMLVLSRNRRKQLIPEITLLVPRKENHHALQWEHLIQTADQLSALCSRDGFYATPYLFQHTHLRSHTVFSSSFTFVFAHWTWALSTIDLSKLIDVYSAALLPFLCDCLARCFCTHPKIASLGFIRRVHTTSCPVVTHRTWRTAQKMCLWMHHAHWSTHILTRWRWSRWFPTKVQPLKVREPGNWIGPEIFIHLILNVIYLMIHLVIIAAFAMRVAPSNWLGSPCLYSFMEVKSCRTICWELKPRDQGGTEPDRNFPVCIFSKEF